jgi:prepilin-type N-terminal cleavage/methylation domain-containing protein
MQRHNARRGFTIVELLVVILVVGILASLVAVTYTRSSAQARDTKRIADLEAISDSITAYRLRFNDHVTNTTCAGAGNGTGNGWFNFVGTGYTKSILSCLTDKGYLNANITAPSGCGTQVQNAPGKTCRQSGYTYMKSTCTVSGQTVTVIMARLELSGAETDLQGANAVCSSSAYATSYQMNYMVKVE